MKIDHYSATKVEQWILIVVDTMSDLDSATGLLQPKFKSSQSVDNKLQHGLYCRNTQIRLFLSEVVDRVAGWIAV